jgi:DNA adenine methylase|tara:strand:+ start:116 stop:892 length:777 start_codon:yes stop_codon:yes gene_type:complete
MTSVLCRIGGKKGKLKEMIIKKMPVDFDLYVEPFVGSGGIYFGADLKNKKSILNDSDKDVMDLYKIMKSGFTMKQYNIPQEVEVQTRFAHATHTNPTDKLLSIIMLGCSSFGGIGRRNNNKMYKPMSSNNIKRKLNHAMDNKEYLKNTRLFNTDYKKIISKFDSPKTFFYFDPPYEESKSLYKSDKQSSGNFNHEEMARVLNGIKGKFILSINDSSRIRNLFKGFKQTRVFVKGGSGHSKGEVNTIGFDRGELLISNY